jgi:hypothetical protein
MIGNMGLLLSISLVFIMMIIQALVLIVRGVMELVGMLEIIIHLFVAVLVDSILLQIVTLELLGM